MGPRNLKFRMQATPEPNLRWQLQVAQQKSPFWDTKTHHVSQFKELKFLSVIEFGNHHSVTEWYRWVLLYPNRDNLNSQIIRNPVETTSQSPQCYSACLIKKCSIWKFFTWYCLFELSGIHPCQFLHFSVFQKKKEKYFATEPSWIYIQNWLMIVYQTNVKEQTKDWVMLQNWRKRSNVRALIFSNNERRIGSRFLLKIAPQTKKAGLNVFSLILARI